MTSIQQIRRRALGGVLGVACVALSACAPSSPDGSEGESESAAGSSLPELDTVIAFSGAAHVAFPDITRMAALPGGGAVVVNLDYNGRILVAFVDGDLALQHAASFAASSVGDVAVDDDTIYVSGAADGDTVRIARFGLDGSLRDIRDLQGIGPPPPNAPGGRLVVDNDTDTLVLLQGVQVVRLDSELQPLWGRTIAASAMTIVDGDYVFAGTPLRPAPANSSGIEVVRTSRDGDVRWQQFATPGPGIHSLAGITVVDGEVVAVCGNDAADTRTTASLRPMFATRFSLDDGAVRGTGAFLLEASVEGTPVSLSFGSGLLVRNDSDGALLFGGVANSGALGQDIRTQVLVRVDGDTVSGRNVGGIFAVATTGAYIAARSTSEGIVLQRIGQLDVAGACDLGVQGSAAPITTIDIANAGGIDLLSGLAARATVATADASPDTPATTTTGLCSP